MRVLCFLFLVVFAAAIGLFVYENNRSVEVTVWKKSYELSFPLLAVGVYLLGMFSGWTVVGILKRSWQRVTEPDYAR